MKDLIASEIAFREERRKYIGGSDAPAVLGLSPWRTPYDVWEDKITPPTEERLFATDEKRKRFARGKRFEPMILDMLADEQGLTLVERNRRLTHPDHPFLACELDAETSDGRNVEAKSVSAFAAGEWGEEGSDQIPLHYAVQTLHGLMITRRRECIVAALIGTDDLRVFRVQRDHDLEATLLSREVEFWQMVQSLTPPPPMTVTDLAKRYPKSLAKVVEVEGPVVDAIVRMKDAKAEAKRLESEIDDCELVIKSALGDADTAMHNGRVLATWKSQDSTRLDTTALKTERPDVYDHFARTISYRVLRLK